mgnify:CR=1 FL=1
MSMYMKGLKKMAIDKTSDAMSVIPRFKAKQAIKRADEEVGIIKKARLYKDAPDFDWKGNPNKEAMVARNNLEDVKYRLKKNASR